MSETPFCKSLYGSSLTTEDPPRSPSTREKTLVREVDELRGRIVTLEHENSGLRLALATFRKMEECKQATEALKSAGAEYNAAREAVQKLLDPTPR